MMKKNELKEVLLDVFRVFIEICEQNNLMYFCAGGTAIGAIRHKGMIPWDDDIDVFMPRQDYDKFIEVFSTLKDQIKYELFTPNDTPNYYLPFIKLCNANTTLLEYKNIPCVIGVGIDIFPLDGASSNHQELYKDWIEFRREANKLLVIPKTRINNFLGFIRHSLRFQLRTAFYELRFMFDKAKAKQQTLKNINSILLKHSFDESRTVGNYCGMWGIKEFGDKNWFKTSIKGDFEFLEVDLAIGIDNFLRNVYGDYMVIPSKENQKSHHNFTYLNLSKKISYDDILYELKKTS